MESALKRIVMVGASALLLAACGDNAAPPAAPAEPVASAPLPQSPPPPVAADPWVGRWNGPEGLFLQIDDIGLGRYRLILKDNLDSQAEYAGVVQDDGLGFVRNGESLIIRQGVGAQTGFKWLDGKQDCLIVVEGREGYCRD